MQVKTGNGLTDGALSMCDQNILGMFNIKNKRYVKVSLRVETHCTFHNIGVIFAETRARIGNYGQGKQISWVKTDQWHSGLTRLRTMQVQAFKCSSSTCTDGMYSQIQMHSISDSLNTQ